MQMMRVDLRRIDGTCRENMDTVPQLPVLFPSNASYGLRTESSRPWWVFWSVVNLLLGGSGEHWYRSHAHPLDYIGPFLRQLLLGAKLDIDRKFRIVTRHSKALLETLSRGGGGGVRLPVP